MDIGSNLLQFMRLQHAKHNEDLCLIIQALPDNYNDWVVTTAFYSCIHYVEHKLFPLELNSINYQNFNQYYYAFFIATNNSTNKHEAKIELVETYLVSVSSNYRWLYDACMNARYKNYMLSNMIASIAVQTMELVKNACT
jgi:hypothetical protein